MQFLLLFRSDGMSSQYTNKSWWRGLRCKINPANWSPEAIHQHHQGVLTLTAGKQDRGLPYHARRQVRLIARTDEVVKQEEQVVSQKSHRHQRPTTSIQSTKKGTRSRWSILPLEFPGMCCAKKKQTHT